MVLELLLLASVERTQLHMGTFATIRVPKNRNYMIEEGFKRIKEVEKALSTYDSEAELFQLNDQKSKPLHSFDLFDALKIAQRLFNDTHGYFTPAIGSITKKMFHFGESKLSIPDEKTLQEANTSQIGYRIDVGRVTLAQGVTLDLGGMGKGYAVDQVRALFNAKGLTEYMVGLSGDIYCRGACSVGIASPFEKDSVIYTLTLNNAAITTSGNYERYVKSVENNHLINPKSHHPQQLIASMTLISSAYSNAMLDGYATALSVMPKKELEEFLNTHPKISYLFITTQHEKCMSKDIQHTIKGTSAFRPCLYALKR